MNINIKLKLHKLQIKQCQSNFIFWITEWRASSLMKKRFFIALYKVPHGSIQERHNNPHISNLDIAQYKCLDKEKIKEFKASRAHNEV